MTALRLRRLAAERIRAAAWAARNRLLAMGRAMVRVPDRLYYVACRFSGDVAGCGCVNDSAECCGFKWCKCACHEENASTTGATS